MAILDTGINIQNPGIFAQADRIKDIRDWTGGAIYGEYGEDVSGHGTQIAGIILDLAPNVDIYIARVSKNGEIDDTKLFKVSGDPVVQL